MIKHFYLVNLFCNVLVQHSIMDSNLIYIALLGSPSEAVCLREWSNDIAVIDLIIKSTCNNTGEVLRIHFIRVMQISDNFFLYWGFYWTSPTDPGPLKRKRKGNSNSHKTRLIVLPISKMSFIVLWEEKRARIIIYHNVWSQNSSLLGLFYFKMAEIAYLPGKKQSLLCANQLIYQPCDHMSTQYTACAFSLYKYSFGHLGWFTQRMQEWGNHRLVPCCFGLDLLSIGAGIMTSKWASHLTMVGHWVAPMEGFSPIQCKFSYILTHWEKT